VAGDVLPPKPANTGALSTATAGAAVTAANDEVRLDPAATPANDDARLGPAVVPKSAPTLDIDANSGCSPSSCIDANASITATDSCSDADAENAAADDEPSAATCALSSSANTLAACDRVSCVDEPGAATLMLSSSANTLRAASERESCTESPP
jgi:hypothetical protein